MARHSQAIHGWPGSTVGPEHYQWLYMTEGSALGESSVPSIFQRTLRNRQKEIESEREINNDVGGNN